MAKPSVTKRIGLGLLVLATIPAIGWVSFSYHWLVGVGVMLIYGSGAFLVGGVSIVSGIALGVERQLPAGDPEPIPAARMLERRNPNA
ncbi:MAG TPA: hypothetical protein VF403_19565 [Kofleriaceae bacterium]